MTDPLTYSDMLTKMQSRALIIAVDRVGHDHKRLSWHPHRVISGYVIDAIYKVYHNGHVVFQSPLCRKALDQYNSITLTNDNS